MKEQLKALVDAVATEVAKQDSVMSVKALEGVLNELSSTMADMVEALEKGDRTDQIVQAIKAIKWPERTGDSAPTINVQPTPVTVKNDINVSPTPVTVEAVVQVPQAPAPVVQVIDRDSTVGAKWEVRIPGGPGRMERFMTITRVN